MSTSEKNIILEAIDLSIGYPSKKGASNCIAKNINFQIQAGQLIGLVGPNGIGKSTLLRTLTKMQPALSGTIEIHGKKMEAYHPMELAQLQSVVLTEPPSSKNLTVQEFVSLGRQPHTNWLGSLSEKDFQQIEWAMEMTEISAFAHKKCFEISDGQLQRVAIARALAQDTPLIFLDEPTTHLDLYHRAYILKLLKRLSQETQKVIIFSTHEIDLAIQLGDAMMVFSEDGFFFNDPCMLIEQGKFEALFPKDSIEFDAKTGRFKIRD